MYYYDPTYILIIAGVVLSLLAQGLVKRVASKYAAVRARCGLTGAELARDMLDRGGLSDVAIEQVAGNLTDHYDPSSNTLRLSAGVYASDSITALGVAAHETGHAFQHRDAYGPLMLRTASVRTVNFGSYLSWPLVVLGVALSWEPLVQIGIALFCFVVLFALITLPVEFNASSRALEALEADGYLAQDELAGARKVLRAAAMTYVASALAAILQLLRLIGISNRRRS